MADKRAAGAVRHRDEDRQAVGECRDRRDIPAANDIISGSRHPRTECSITTDRQFPQQTRDNAVLHIERSRSLVESAVVRDLVVRGAAEFPSVV